jgi:hypothetical protein
MYRNALTSLCQEKMQLHTYLFIYLFIYLFTNKMVHGISVYLLNVMGRWRTPTAVSWWSNNTHPLAHPRLHICSTLHVTTFCKWTLRHYSWGGSLSRCKYSTRSYRPTTKLVSSHFPRSVHSYTFHPVLILGPLPEHVTSELVSTLTVNGKFITVPAILPRHIGYNLNKLFSNSNLLRSQILI